MRCGLSLHRSILSERSPWMVRSVSCVGVQALLQRACTGGLDHRRRIQAATDGRQVCRWRASPCAGPQDHCQHADSHPQRYVLVLQTAWTPPPATDLGGPLPWPAKVSWSAVQVRSNQSVGPHDACGKLVCFFASVSVLGYWKRSCMKSKPSRQSPWCSTGVRRETPDLPFEFAGRLNTGIRVWHLTTPC